MQYRIRYFLPKQDIAAISGTNIITNAIVFYIFGE
jgi:hypothetical protein